MPCARGFPLLGPLGRWVSLLSLALVLAPLGIAAAGAAEPRPPEPAAEPLAAPSLFSDLQPSDWAYQALINLIERHGCARGLAAGSDRGQRALSRFEAAALLKACLDRVTETSDALRALLQHFEAELALLRGRVDGLEARLAEQEATTFATTTTLNGQAVFVVGGNSFHGSASALVNDSRAAFGATTFSYDLQLSLDTSFTGKDLLRANLRAGNFGGNSFGGAGPSSLSQLEVAFQEDLGNPAASGSDVMAIDRLFYRFPLGAFTVIAGGRVGQEDMLAIWPSVYPDATVLDVLTLPGSPAAYNKNLGAGGGISWQWNGLAISANVVAANGDQGNAASGGVGTAGSGSSGTVQIGYAAEQWALAAIYSRLQNGHDLIAYGTAFALASFGQPGTTSAFALSGYWQPASGGWWPSLSAGWGLNSTRYDAEALQTAGSSTSTLLSTSQSWSVGLQWLDAFLPGNALGVAVGQPTFATRLRDGSTPNDGNLVWEGWYKLRLTDAISLTPALFYLSRPLGQATPAGESFGQLGGLLKTTVRF